VSAGGDAYKWLPEPRPVRRRFPWRLALRVVTIAELGVACVLGVSGACPWPIALVAAEAVLAAFLSTLPEPVQWVAVESERVPAPPPAGFTIGMRVEPGVVSPGFSQRVCGLLGCVHGGASDTCRRCGAPL